MMARISPLTSFDRRSLLLGSTALLSGCAGLGHVRPAGGTTEGDEAFLLEIARRTFNYFRDTHQPDNGLAPDRWPTVSFASIAATGFALTAWPIGVSRGWMARGEARKRTLATVRFFAAAKQGPEAEGVAGYRGFFYHFLGLNTGTRLGQTELSTIDTALLLGGILFAQSYFDRRHPEEAEIRALAQQIYDRVEWTWPRPRQHFLAMGWHPEQGFIASDWDSFNESLLLYVLALGSPTNPIEPETWDRWTATFDRAWNAADKDPYIAFPPLFGFQYSHMWVDFREIHDAYNSERQLDYFENSRRATYAQREYAIRNPGGWDGYGPNVWGLTACDGPGDFTIMQDGVTRQYYSYSARGPGDRDDGTLAPTAAAGSIAFAPEIVLPALREMQTRYGRAIFGEYGFWDSFNPSLKGGPIRYGRIVPGVCWVDGDYIGIDQGPILGMIENHLTGFIWKVMRRNPNIVRGLRRAGFKGGWLDAKPARAAG
ncbi:glucoamylase family protein [Sphingomonas crusticola]|uniref:glucoamylase family protein n=1 Tax=Sphingomonas crusticola TaxID=1697973 RepID=UPI001F08496E|nr:glucoamylase family protein [Sphingomonas crusticola]